MVIQMFENMFKRVESRANSSYSIDDAIIDFMKNYFQENFDVELEYIKKNSEGDNEFFRTAINRKVEIHKKYWCNLDEFWMPCSVSSEPKFNWSRVKEIQVLRSEDDNNMQYLFVYKYAKLIESDYESKKAYVIKLKNNTLKIDQNFY